jgi:formate--tetrahydrofolate ligase
VITEAGFGADLGAEKFIDIKCRKGNLKPAAAVIVATVRAVKYHGGVPVPELTSENLPALETGATNLLRHVDNVVNRYGLPCVVAINHRVEDTPAETQRLQELVAPSGVKVIPARHFVEGGAGAIDVAQEVVRLCEQKSNFKFMYDDGATLWEKIRAVATGVYQAADIDADPPVRAELTRLQHAGYGHFPVCIAKTQYSFSTDPKLRGAPAGHIVKIREVRLAAGAEFIVAICGEIMTMPGLPKEPASNHIDIDENGRVVGLF